MSLDLEEIIYTKRVNYNGVRFGKLTVLYDAELKERVRKVVCQCDCGNKTTTVLSSLKNGHTKSCGCYHKEAPLIHGMSGTAEFKTWISMNQRCDIETTDAVNFKHYASRGIKVSDLWINSFKAFYDHVGPKPSKDHSIDRIDVNGNYEPGNVRWATSKEQANNRTNTLMITFNGVTKPAKFWTEYLGINYNTFYDRYSKGWSVEDALLKPIASSRFKPKN